MPFGLVDTAGLRITTDTIEQEGVRRSNDQISSADFILFLLDSSAPLGGSLDDVLSLLNGYGDKVLLVINKTDIQSPGFEEDSFKKFETIAISCITRQGVGELTKKLVKRAIGGFDSNSSSITLQSDRHRQLLKMTKNSLFLRKMRMLIKLEMSLSP